MVGVATSSGGFTSAEPPDAGRLACREDCSRRRQAQYEPLIPNSAGFRRRARMVVRLRPERAAFEREAAEFSSCPRRSASQRDGCDRHRPRRPRCRPRRRGDLPVVHVLQRPRQSRREARLSSSTSTWSPDLDPATWSGRSPSGRKPSAGTSSACAARRTHGWFRSSRMQRRPSARPTSPAAGSPRPQLLSDEEPLRPR